MNELHDHDRIFYRQGSIKFPQPTTNRHIVKFPFAYLNLQGKNREKNGALTFKILSGS